MKKYRNMRTPFWNFVEGLVKMISGLAQIVTLGFYVSDFYGDWLEWKLRQMFVEVNAK